MSVLLVAPPRELGHAIVGRLLAQGDEVRVLVEHAEGVWRDQGAHVAMGDVTDDDLVMRAGQHARTIVLFGPERERIDACIKGARMARIDRAVLVLDAEDPGPTESAVAELPSYVILRTARSRWRRRVDPFRIAEAVDAADDLAGDVRLTLDLTRADAWTALGLTMS